jgi:small subunit ribosomal protein S9
MNIEKQISIGIGKRKTSIAKVYLQKGNGIFKINNLSFDLAFLSSKEEKEKIYLPFNLLNLQNQYDVNIKVKGGGINAQLEAIQLAISKALIHSDSTYRATLKKESLLTRDSRIKERRKYGLKKARKASQYSKR